MYKNKSCDAKYFLSVEAKNIYMCVNVSFFQHYMNELSTKLIIEMHNRIIADYGGTRGILCDASIDFLIFKCNEKKDVFKKAAYILYKIIQNHPFVDGNKRTALEVADVVLRKEGYYILERKQIINFLLTIAKTNIDDCEIVLIEEWIKRKSRRLKKPITTG